MIRTQRILLQFLLPLTLVLAVVSGLEIWAQQRFQIIPFDPLPQEKLISENPDLICVGNSTLNNNIVKDTFTTKLKEIYGRPIKVSFFSAGGMHSSWYYLFLKNQIAKTPLKQIPILFFDYEDFYVRPSARTSSSMKSELTLKKNLLDDESIFREKIGNESLYFLSGFPYLYTQRSQIKRWITSEVILSFLNFSGLSRSIKSRRWGRQDSTAVTWLLGTLFTGSNFRGGIADDSERNDHVAFTGSSKADFVQAADASFLPEILKFKDRFKLIFVLSNSNPNMPQMKESIAVHAERLAEYVKDRGGYLIDLNKRAELQEGGLMHDSRHFTKGLPREKNTQALLDELKAVLP